MISEKDRAQLLRMAGNIAGGMMAEVDNNSLVNGYLQKTENYEKAKSCVADIAAELALSTMQAVDRLVEQEEENGN